LTNRWREIFLSVPVIVIRAAPRTCRCSLRTPDSSSVGTLRVPLARNRDSRIIARVCTCI
jgi:hypothetical protein